MTNHDPIDELRLAHAAATDVDAFARLYRLTLPRVYRYHMAHTGNAMDAEDLCSQTFMAALEGIRSFRGDGSFTAWILGIASRKRLMFFRGTKPEVPLEAAFQLPSPGIPPDTEAFQRLELQTISHALRQITPERAEAIVLSFFGGLANGEIAHLLGKSEAAIKMLLSRGLHDLRERTSLVLETEV
jgi:RNA polymerase sigma-70 factor (ECF subfamily)